MSKELNNKIKPARPKEEQNYDYPHRKTISGEYTTIIGGGANIPGQATIFWVDTDNQIRATYPMKSHLKESMLELQENEEFLYWTDDYTYLNNKP